MMIRALIPPLMLLSACHGAPQNETNRIDEVAVPTMQGIEFTAGTWTRKGDAALYLSPEQEVLFALRCDKPGKRIVFTLPGSLPDGAPKMRIEADGVGESYAATDAQVDDGDDALIEAEAPSDGAFVQQKLGDTPPQRIGAKLEGGPGFVAPWDPMLGAIVKGCR